ncbi:MAG: RNA polymerase sigma factor [Ilumatobacteraceae bacterium]
MTNDDHVVLLRRNDRAAWEAFYDSLAGELRGYVRRIGARDPDDVLGEVMVQVVRHLPPFTGTSGELRPWVFRIARNRVIDSARRRSRRVEEVPLED